MPSRVVATRLRLLVLVVAIAVAAGWSAVGVAAAAPITAQGRAACPAVASPTIGVAHGHLTLSGAPYRFVGLNAYELATSWGQNAGCGAMLGDAALDGFFASIPPHSLVRIWAWQGSMAINYRTKQLDWGPLDRVFRVAAMRHDFLLVSLAGQDGTCDDGHWKNAAWYLGGYRRGSTTTGGVSRRSLIRSTSRRSFGGTRPRPRSACGNRSTNPKHPRVLPATRGPSVTGTLSALPSDSAPSRCASSSTRSVAKYTAWIRATWSSPDSSAAASAEHRGATTGT